MATDIKKTPTDSPRDNKISPEKRESEATIRSESNQPKREKMDIPQRPGNQIVIGPEGPYSEDAITSPPPDSDAR